MPHLARACDEHDRRQFDPSLDGDRIATGLLGFAINKDVEGDSSNDGGSSAKTRMFSRHSMSSCPIVPMYATTATTIVAFAFTLRAKKSRTYVCAGMTG